MNQSNAFKRISKWGTSGGSLCFYCGVDSTELTIYLVSIIALLVIGAIFFALASWARGDYKNTELVKEKIFDYESRE